jgi:hypothetical protein
MVYWEKCRKCGTMVGWDSREQYEFDHGLCDRCSPPEHTVRFGNPRYWGSTIFSQDPEEPDVVWIGGRYYFAKKKGLLRRKYANLTQRTLPHEYLHHALDSIDESEAADALDNYSVFGYMGQVDPSTGLRPFDEIERAMRRRRKR